MMDFGDLIGGPHRWARLFCWTALVGILCGIVGPYGSYIANTASRICFWVSLFWAGTLILWPSVAAALYFAERKGLPAIFAGIGAALLACMPLAAFAAAACRLFWPVHASGIRPQEWYGQTVVLAVPAAAIAFWFEWFRLCGNPQSPAADILRAGDDQPRTGMLPDRLLDLIMCLQMEDHHVRYYTAAGSQLHFAPMRDVVRQLGEGRGLQVHRSWWVATAAVRGSIGESRSLTLILSNDLKVPVARSRVAVIRAAGYLTEPSEPSPPARFGLPKRGWN